MFWGGIVPSSLIDSNTAIFCGIEILLNDSNSARFGFGFADADAVDLDLDAELGGRIVVGSSSSITNSTGGFFDFDFTAFSLSLSPLSLSIVLARNCSKSSTLTSLLVNKCFASSLICGS